MAGASEILVGTGAVAIVAAVVGGGLRARDIEFPLLTSVTRQVLLALTGFGLIAAGLVVAAPSADPAPEIQNQAAPAPVPEAEVRGADWIDFRSSDENDSFAVGSNRGHLMVTTGLSVRNRREPSRRLEWTRNVAYLVLGAEDVTYRPFAFVELPPEGPPWLGTNRSDPAPIAVGPGEVAARTIMFLPARSSGRLYSWDDFLRHLASGAGTVRPIFRIEAYVDEGTGQPKIKSWQCAAAIEGELEGLRSLIRDGANNEPKHTFDCA
jgi:hypothetical protein